MIIIWRGYGWLVAVIVFGFSLIANLLFNASYGEGYYDRHRWLVAVAMLSAGAICWSLGQALRKTIRSHRYRQGDRSGNGDESIAPRALLYSDAPWGPVLGAVAGVLFILEFVRR